MKTDSLYRCTKLYTMKELWWRWWKILGEVVNTKQELNIKENRNAICQIKALFGIPEFQVQVMILFLQAECTCNSTSWQDQLHYSSARDEWTMLQCAPMHNQ